LQIYKEMKSIFKDASMNIREFFSNTKEFNAQIPEQDLAEVNETKKILGMNWNPHNDSIEIILKPWSNHEPTKRTILQFIASQFDPSGYLVPAMVSLKIFLQTLWKKNASWDQKLEEEEVQTWKSLINSWSIQMKKIQRIAIDPSQQLNFQVFTDASISAYAATVYAQQGTKISLIFAKSRIIPIKGMTIPKAELLAILTGVRAVKFVIKQLDFENAKVTLWSDSRCALHWIQNQSRLLPRFI
ncbi:unnamed protein product, partial [Onchocerca ochengi]